MKLYRINNAPQTTSGKFEFSGLDIGFLSKSHIHGVLPDLENGIEQENFQVQGMLNALLTKSNSNHEHNTYIRGLSVVNDGSTIKGELELVSDDFSISPGLNGPVISYSAPDTGVYIGFKNANTSGRLSRATLLSFGEIETISTDDEYIQFEYIPNN